MPKVTFLKFKHKFIHFRVILIKTTEFKPCLSRFIIMEKQCLILYHSNKRKKWDLYHLHIDLEREYEHVQKKNNVRTLTRLDKENMRISGKKHVDLWCDGKLYPKNPLNNSSPSFSNPSSLLRFIGDGHGGLLGYCNDLSSHAETFRHLY